MSQALNLAQRSPRGAGFRHDGGDIIDRNYQIMIVSVHEGAIL